MTDGYKCFYEKKVDGFIQFICFLVGDFINELVLPLEVWPCSCLYDEKYVHLVDAQSVVHAVLDPKIIHFDQINRNRFVVNFYTKDGDEVDYGRTKDHCHKCLVLGCHDPRMYQERVCESEMFYASKVIVISSDKYGGLFIGKVIHGFISDTDVVTKNISGTGESSNLAVVSEKSFVIEFSSCAETKGYLDVLELNVGDRMHFQLVFGNLTSDEAMFFDVCKVV
ncbi:hypothetical protein Tco_0564110 [Tanacetum coccineum]